jgi:transcriptional regulator with XRE-family HTH domain
VTLITPTVYVEVTHMPNRPITSTKIVDIPAVSRYSPCMLSPQQCRAARGWLDWSQEELARRSNVSLSTVRDFEKGRRMPIGNNMLAIEQALKDGGVNLLFDQGEPSGVSGKSRISERDLLIPALEYLDHKPDGFMTTTELKEALELQFQPSDEDAGTLVNRGDIKFTQIVRNIVSHRSSPTNLIGAGYATYDKKRRGLTITDKGRARVIRPEI